MQPLETVSLPELPDEPAPTPRRNPVAEAIAQARAAAEALAAEYPDLADDERAWLDTLDGITDAIDVADRFIRRSLARKRLADAATQEIADLQERKARFTRQAEAARNLALTIIAAAVAPDGKGRLRLERPSYTASLRTSPATVFVTDLSKLPETLLRPPAPREPDKATIAKMLKDGAKIEGAELRPGAPYLEVRTR